MGNENSLPEDGMEGEPHSPVSEAGPAESIISSVTGMAGRLSRRASSSSLAQYSSGQHTPVGAPDVDMSHLSAEEKAQIAAVIERAKWLQEEEMQRVRELEQEYTEYTATVAARRASAAGQEVEREICPICTTAELRPDNKTKCVDCEKYVCNKCGCCETSLPAKTQEWLCSLCQKKRNLSAASGKWYHGQASTGDLPKARVDDGTNQGAPNQPPSEIPKQPQQQHSAQLQQQPNEPQQPMSKPDQQAPRPAHSIVKSPPDRQRQGMPQHQPHQGEARQPTHPANQHNHQQAGPKQTQSPSKQGQQQLQGHPEKSSADPRGMQGIPHGKQGPVQPGRGPQPPWPPGGPQRPGQQGDMPGQQRSNHGPNNHVPHGPPGPHGPHGPGQQGMMPGSVQQGQPPFQHGAKIGPPPQPGPPLGPSQQYGPRQQGPHQGPSHPQGHHGHPYGPGPPRGPVMPHDQARGPGPHDQTRGPGPYGPHAYGPRGPPPGPRMGPNQHDPRQRPPHPGVYPPQQPGHQAPQQPMNEDQVKLQQHHQDQQQRLPQGRQHRPDDQHIQQQQQLIQQQQIQQQQYQRAQQSRDGCIGPDTAHGSPGKQGVGPRQQPPPHGSVNQFRDSHDSDKGPQSTKRGANEGMDADRVNTRSQESGHSNSKGDRPPQRVYQQGSPDTHSQLKDDDRKGSYEDLDYNGDAQGRSRKSPRPQNLTLSRQHSANSTSSEDETSKEKEKERKEKQEAQEKERLTREQERRDREKRGERERELKERELQRLQDEAKLREMAEREMQQMRERETQKQQEVTSQGPQGQDLQHQSVKPDMRGQPRAGAEGSEGPKKKPTALDRVHHDHVNIREQDRSQSPSRRSPKSPPRSPSWMRYRESPPRSPPVRMLSPNRSPTERFPSTYVDRSPTGIGGMREDTYGEEYVDQYGNVFSFDSHDMHGDILGERRGSGDIPPPKPARMLEQYDFNDDEHRNISSDGVLDLASYAATVASDTAHLTSMSVSPTNLLVPEPAEHEHYLEVSPDLESISPPSPNYFEEVEDVQFAEPTPKNIDIQNTKRQKIKPPATDWSPVTDLSPILDVSPSIERLEQEKMLIEQRKALGQDIDSQSQQRPGSKISAQDRQSQSDQDSSQQKVELRRYKHMEDISQLDKSDTRGDSIVKKQIKQLESKETVEEKTQPRLIKDNKHIDSEKSGKPGDPLTKSRDIIKEPPVIRQKPDYRSGRSYIEAVPPERNIHDHPGFEVDEDREIDLDDDLPPKIWDRERRDDKKIKRSLPEPTPEILATARKPASGMRDVDRKDQKGLAARREQLHTQSSLNGDSTTTKGTTSRKPPIRSASLEGDLPMSREGKVKRSPLYLTLHEPDDDQLFAPKYKVLKSPVSPSASIAFSPDQGEFEYGHSPTGEGVSAEARAHLYPSPEPPPDMDLSPPVPASPSVPELEPDEMGYFSHWSQPKHSRSRSHSAKFSTQTNAIDQIQSPDDPSKKVRRRLPAVPPDQEPVGRRPRSKSVEPQEDKANNEKELLRKRLQEKEAEQRRHVGEKGKPAPGKGTKEQTNSRVRPQSAPPKHTATDDNKQKGIKPQPRLGTGGRGKITEPPARPKVPPKPLPKPQVKPGGKVPPKTAPKPGSKPGSRTVTPSSTPPAKPSPKRRKMPKPIETINVYGLQVPVDVKSLKQRIKEEMQIVTATRRLKIDEADEIRRMEAEMAEREKERKLKEEREDRDRKIREIERKRDIERMEKEKREAEIKTLTEKNIPERPKYDPRRKITPPAATITSRMSPQASPRRARHKRQNSDPMIAKFSPIEEHIDIESDMSYKLGLEARRIASTIGRLSPQPLRHHMMRRSGAVTPPGTSEFEDSYYTRLPQQMLNPNLSRSTEVLHRYSRVESAGRLAASRSETNIPLTAGYRSRTPTGYYSDNDDKRRKQEKKHLLQIEIEKRKRQLEDNARLQYELRQLSQSADITRMELEDARINYQRHLQNLNQDMVPTGIIKPLDYMDIGGLETEQYAHHEYAAYRELLEQMAQSDFYVPERSGAGYSASEYLAHRSEHSPTKQDFDPAYVTSHMPSGEFPLADVYYADGRYVYVPTAHPVPYPEKGDASTHMYPGFAGSRDSGMSSSMTIADAFAHKTELEMAAAPFEGYAGSPLTTDTETSPPSDTTPAMPILDDVTKRSRSLLRSVGSRPLSDDMEKYFQAEDPLTAMFRADSEHSIADSDENIMEGGVTIRRSERKKLQQSQARSLDSEPPPPRKYKFPTKRILLTRDPKDRSVKGADPSKRKSPSNGIGMKIIGGKVIPGTDGRVGAYVAAIYPGGVADQLHGELQEGDQVLEWNGVTLTGKSYEEVQQIISAQNGEIELVVRPGANMGAKHSNTMSTLRSDSCHSSYDNLDFTSDYDEFERYIEPERGVDPDVLAAQLEDIHDRMSPGGSPSSSQQDMYLTPSMSTPASSEQTDPPSPSVELPPADEKPPVRRSREKVDWGEIQLQLSYDDYDSTLNVHVIQARRLQAKDKNGLSDPFVKVQLMPSRGQELKRRTKTIPRTLDPEWHQTLVFMNIPRHDLASKILEVTVWDHDRFKPNDFLGEVQMNLSDSTYLDNKPHWYNLRDREESTYSHHQASKPQTASPPTSSSSSASRHMRAPGPEHGVGRSPRPSRASQLSTPEQGASTKYSPGLGRRQTGHAGEPKGESKEKRHTNSATTPKLKCDTVANVDEKSSPKKKRSSLSRQTNVKNENVMQEKHTNSTSETDKMGPRDPSNTPCVQERKRIRIEDNPPRREKDEVKPVQSSQQALTRSPGKKTVTVGGCHPFPTAPIDQVPKSKAIADQPKRILGVRDEKATKQSIQQQIEQRQRLSPEKKLRKCQDWQDKHQELHQHHRHHSHRYQKPSYPKMGTQSAATSPTKPPISPKHVPTHTRHHSLQDEYIHSSGSPSSPFSVGSHVSLSQSSYVSSDTLTSFSYDSVITGHGYQQNGYLEMDSPPPYNKYFYSSSVEEDSISMFSMGPGQVLPSSLMDSESDSFENTSYFVTGELMLGLKHGVKAKNLQVSILHCRNINGRLFPGDITRDWYVKMYLRLGEDLSKVKKRKTHTQRCPTDPSFHEIFNYHTDCKHVYLELSLWIHKGIFGPNKAIGMTLVALDQLQFEDEKEFFCYYKLLAQRKVD